MSVTLRQFMDGKVRWLLAEKGLQVLWNELNQIIASEAGSSITGGTTVLSTADLIDGTGTGIQKSSLRTISGPFAITGGEQTVTGEQVIPPDPGGHYSPTPLRISNSTPTNGFRPSV